MLDIDDRAVVFAQDFCHRHVRACGSAAKLPAVSGRGVLVLEKTMQERGVRRIDADFQRLQPIAVDVALERKGVAVRCDKAVDLGKCRRFAFAKISPKNAALLDQRIGALPDALAELRAFWLGRRLQALTGRVEQPAVKGAAQAAILEPAKSEVGAAMRAMPFDQA